MPRVKLTLTGYDAALRKAKSFEELVPLIAAKALHNEAKRMMQRSQERVPVVTGKLKSAGYVRKPVFFGDKVASVELGYDGDIAPYAFAVHEIPRSGKTEGTSPKGQPYQPGTWAREGGWKFLDEPVNEMAATTKHRMAVDIRETLRLFRAGVVK